MCLAIPAEVISVENETATVDLDGVQLPVSLAFLSDVEPGDFVVVHVGYALSKIDKVTAELQIQAMKAGSVMEALS